MGGGEGGCLCMVSFPVWLPGSMFFLGGLCSWSHVPSGGFLSRRSLSRESPSRGLCPGGLRPGGSLPWGSLSGGLCPGGFCVWGGGVGVGSLCSGQKSRRYASYWNAFLFSSTYSLRTFSFIGHVFKVGKTHTKYTATLLITK